MRSVPTPGGRRSKRVMLKRRASLVVDLDRDEKRLPCLVLDSSKEGHKLRGSLHLRRGQSVEIVFDPEPCRSVRCLVVWVGRAGSKQEEGRKLSALGIAERMAASCHKPEK